MYYNSTKLTGKTLKEAKAKTKSQDETIKAFYKKKKRSYTPFEIQALAFKGKDVPITSIRRSLTNLTDEGFLVKAKQRRGIYNKPNYTWKRKY